MVMVANITHCVVSGVQGQSFDMGTQPCAPSLLPPPECSSARVCNLAGLVFCFAAVGCPEMTAPSGGWVRTLDAERGKNALGGLDDSVMMSCNDSSETWYLTCTSNHWLGQQANCTSTHSQYIHCSPNL